MRITKILLAVDGSEQAQRAANYALQLARMMDASVLVAHCYQPMPIGVEQVYPQLMDELLALAEQVAAPYVAQLQEAGLRRVEARIVEGAAGEKLAELAKDEGCDLIVIGSRGRTQLTGLLLGSVAQRVLHYASCPVLVIR